HISYSYHVNKKADVCWVYYFEKALNIWKPKKDILAKKVVSPVLVLSLIIL
ncbi:hypothetical protein QR685DRAFT_447160, partial [Neurospora intermedia]